MFKILFGVFFAISSMFYFSSCAGKKLVDPNLIRANKRNVPDWVNNIRKVKKQDKNKIYIVGIGESNSEKMAKMEAANSAALQYSRYLKTTVKSSETETDTALNLQSERVIKNLIEQITNNELNNQFNVEYYVERRYQNIYEKDIEYYKVYLLCAFDKTEKKNNK